MWANRLTPKATYILAELENGRDLNPATLRQQSTASEQEHDPEALKSLLRLIVRIRRKSVYRACLVQCALLKLAVCSRAAYVGILVI